MLYYCADKRAVLYALYDHLQYSSQFIFSLHTRVPFLFMGIGLEVFLSCFICQACIYVNIDYFQQLKIIDSVTVSKLLLFRSGSSLNFNRSLRLYFLRQLIEK